MTKQQSVDFLIVGAGIAGLSAALECAPHGSVAIISKGPIKESATQYAQGGIAAAVHGNDTPQLHFEDTIKAGDGLCDESAVKILVEEGPKHVQRLIELGANFDKDGNNYDLTKEGAHSQRRILHAKDATGREIEKTLGNAALAHKNITFFPNTMIASLNIRNNVCYGCTAVHNKTPFIINATATLLATGGCGQVYSHTTNPRIATGDGIALAHKAGCEITDMEFIQFHPTTVNLGGQKPISIFLISEAVRGEGAVLRNIHGERFMKNYHPLAELAPRDIVARAIYQETQKTKHHIYLDLEPIKESIPERFPTIYQTCLESGIDITTDLVPVTPAAHYMMGGIKTNLNAQTSIQHLYAAGEVACNGIHGANRLASNSLLDGLVFGHRAAEHMKKEPNLSPPSSMPLPTETELSPDQKSKIKAAKQALRSTMWRKVSLIRSESELTSALKTVQSMDWIQAITTYDTTIMEIQNMLIVAEKIISAALNRTESRGAHFRVK